jgi:hypothetical protein
MDFTTFATALGFGIIVVRRGHVVGVLLSYIFNLVIKFILFSFIPGAWLIFLVLKLKFKIIDADNN